MDGAGFMNKLMSLIASVLKFTIALILMSAIGLGGYWVYEKWSLAAERNNALGRFTTKDDWQWMEKSLAYSHSGSHRRNYRPTDLQYRINDEGKYILRRVYSDYKAEAWITDDGGLSIQISWPVECEPGAELETSVETTSGDRVPLRCGETDWGTVLFTKVGWRDFVPGNPHRLNENFDGFKVDEEFGRWYWEPVIRYRTLQRLSDTGAP